MDATAVSKYIIKGKMKEYFHKKERRYIRII